MTISPSTEGLAHDACQAHREPELVSLHKGVFPGSRRRPAKDIRVRGMKTQKFGVGHREIREIRENRVAFLRVFRVLRGEEASRMNILRHFAQNQ